MYIRCNNGKIYEIVVIEGQKCVKIDDELVLTFEFFIANNTFVNFKEDGSTSLIKPNIKEADTIEELCDELVLIEEDYPIILEELDFKRRTYLRANEYEFLSKLPEKPIIYGAIWTDKGLIYVAKMDAEGKLILL